MSNPNPQQAAFIEATEGKTEARDVNVRGAGDGYILTGQRRWSDPVSGILAVQLTAETVATETGDAVAKVQAFLDNGAF